MKPSQVILAFLVGLLIAVPARAVDTIGYMNSTLVGVGLTLIIAGLLVSEVQTVRRGRRPRESWAVEYGYVEALSEEEVRRRLREALES